MRNLSSSHIFQHELHKIPVNEYKNHFVGQRNVPVFLHKRQFRSDYCVSSLSSVTWQKALRTVMMIGNAVATETVSMIHRIHSLISVAVVLYSELHSIEYRVASLVNISV